MEFSLHAPFFEINLGSFFEDIRQISKVKIKHAIDVALAIGCDPVVVHPGYTFLTDKVKDIERMTKERFIEDLVEICAYARERGLRIALENVHMPVFFFYEFGQFRELHNIIPDLGITFDLGHAYVTQCSKGAKDPDGAIVKELQGMDIGHIFHVHLHNNRGVRDDHTFFSGKIDMRRILKTLYEKQYTGKVIVESYDVEEHGIKAVLKKLETIIPST